MTSLNSSVGSKSTDLSLPRDAAFSSGGSEGAVRSPWISRLRPPPPSSRHPPLPADKSDATDPEARSSQGGITFSTRESRTRPRSRSDDLDGPPFLVRRYLSLLRTNPTPPPRSSSRLLRREAPGAAASSSYHQPLQQSERREDKKQRQPLGPEADLGHRRGAEAEHEEAAAKKEGTRGRRDCRVAGFGPFQVSSKRTRLPLGKGHKQQQEHSQWKSEGERGGGCGTAPAGVAEKGSYKSYLGDGFFPIFRGIVGFSPMREEGEVEEKDRKELQAEMRQEEQPDETGEWRSRLFLKRR